MEGLGVTRKHKDYSTEKGPSLKPLQRRTRVYIFSPRCTRPGKIGGDLPVRYTIFLYDNILVSKVHFINGEGRIIE